MLFNFLGYEISISKGKTKEFVVIHENFATDTEYVTLPFDKTKKRLMKIVLNSIPNKIEKIARIKLLIELVKKETGGKRIGLKEAKDIVELYGGYLPLY